MIGDTRLTFTVLIIISLVISLTGYHFFAKRMKNLHQTVWDELGRPEIFQKNTPPAPRNKMRSINKFLIFREYRALNDLKLTALGNFVFIVMTFNLILWIGLFWFSAMIKN